MFSRFRRAPASELTEAAPIPEAAPLPEAISNFSEIVAAVNEFHSRHYMIHTARRLEHLSALGLKNSNKTVLDVGAGIGDHSLFYMQRGCHVTALEPRRENCAAFRMLWPMPDCVDIIEGGYEALEDMCKTFDIVHAYGFLYHVSDPARAIELLASRCSNYMVLETCVTPGNHLDRHLVSEPKEVLTQAVEGQGCRPTRPWIHQELRKYFPFVYFTRTQPNHPEFPLDWTAESFPADLTRSVFVASRLEINNHQLRPDIPDFQSACV